MKNALLTSAAVVAIAVAGVSTASASTLSYRATTASPPTNFATDIDSAVTGGATAPYFIAAESSSILTSGTNANDLALTLDLTGSATLPSTGVTLDITLTGNAVWGVGGVTPADVTGSSAGCSTFTVVPVSGGAAGTKTASFLISNSNATCEGVNLDLPVTLTSAAVGDVVVSTALSVSGTPIDPPQGSLTAIRVANAFSATVTADTGVVSPYPTDTIIDGPGFTAFLSGGSYDAVLGTVAVARQASSYRNLTIANTTADADITDFDVSVTGTGAGIFTATDLSAASTVTGTAATVTANTSTNEGALNATGVGSIVLGLVAGGPAIPPSAFTAAVTTTLGAGYTANTGPTASGSLQQIVREGVTVLVPWLSSATRGGAGTNNNVRISNNGGAPAAVFAEVINTRFAGVGYTNPGLVQIGVIAAGTSANWNSTTLEGLLGDYGQADIRITVAGAANAITIKRVQQTADGGITEVSLGTATADVANSN